ncbi:hypothetical protein GN956_G18274 [Arapaima gigas]
MVYPFSPFTWRCHRCCCWMLSFFSITPKFWSKLAGLRQLGKALVKYILLHIRMKTAAGSMEMSRPF